MRTKWAALSEQNQALRAQVKSLEDGVQDLRIENKILQEKIRFLTQRLFGHTSEKVDRNQLELLLGDVEEASLVESAPEVSATRIPPRRKSRGERKVRIPAGTPTEDIVMDPEEVQQEPDAYEPIGEEITHELDIVPHPYIHRRFIRRKYKSKTDRSLAPIVAPAPPRLIDGSIASVGLLVDIILKKYVDHLPFHRQEQTLRTRYGIEISRKTMCDWVGHVANWLQSIYRQMRSSLRESGYLQVDETPVKYNGAEGGGSAQGYFWVYHPPGGDVLYEWHTGRGRIVSKRCWRILREPFNVMGMRRIARSCRTGMRSNWRVVGLTCGASSSRRRRRRRRSPAGCSIRSRNSIRWRRSFATQERGLVWAKRSARRKVE